MARYFVHNLETDKLNIFTGGKSDWLTIPEADRERLKNSCLWSRSINGWVSRSKGGKVRFYAVDVLERNGFEYRGTEGDRLSFMEQIEVKQERAENRADRFELRAEKAETVSNEAFKRSRQMMDAIPMGQPILIGHHSETRDRNYRNRAWNLLGKAVSESDKAKHYEQRASIARGTADGAQYSNPRYLGNRITESRAEIARLENRLQGKCYSYSEPKPISDEYRERLTEVLNRELEKLEFYEHCLATCGVTIYSKATLAGKTAVKIRGRWEPIVKLNPSTVAVPNICFPTAQDQCKYALKYPYTSVEDAR